MNQGSRCRLKVARRGVNAAETYSKAIIFDLIFLNFEDKQEKAIHSFIFGMRARLINNHKMSQASSGFKLKTRYSIMHVVEG